MNMDQFWFKKVRDLVATARLALEEAENAVEDIADPQLREQAQELVDSI